MRDTRSSQEIQRQKDVAREERKRPEVDAALKNMLGLEGVSNGKTPEYRARYEFTFWTTEKQKFALALMEGGMDFMEAFDATNETYRA